MPRQARLDAPGTLHHVILRGIEKRNIVSNRKDKEDFVSRMGQLAAETDTAIYAWVLMSNHAHILIRSSAFGLSRYMRRFLTGYAIAYNLRHHRYGHLFQNRYKSIVCEEDTYFQELVRYIHLNPLRAGLVKDMRELDKYLWCGNSVLMGKVKNRWQDRDYVLRWFGRREGEAKKAYRMFMQKGVSLGRRPELVGGGLIRSMGGWSQVKSLRRLGMRDMFDERILGSGEFVERVITEAEEKLKYEFPSHEGMDKVQGCIQLICAERDINVKELAAGSRRRHISEIRSQIAVRLVEEYGVSLAETARQLGVSTSAICKIIKRREGQ